MEAEDKKYIMDGKFYVKNENTAVCTICNKEFKYHRSLTSLQYHLSNKHVFTKLPSQVASSSTSTQPTLSSFLQNNKPVSKARSDAITESIAKWIAKDSRPLSVVADSGLQKVLKLATGDPTYEMPSRRSIGRKLAMLYEDIKVQKVAKLGEAYSMAVTCDYWTSVANDSYLGLFCHFIDKNWILESFAVGLFHTTERHTAETVKAQISTILNDWNLSEKNLHYWLR